MPVLSPAEAAALASGKDSAEGTTPAPHPLLSRTPALEKSVEGVPQAHRYVPAQPKDVPGSGYLAPGAHTEEVLREVLGLGDQEIEALYRQKVIEIQQRPSAKL